MSGLSPMVEIEVPTHGGPDRETHTLVGVSAALANEDVAFNESFHWDPFDAVFEGSASLAVRACARTFPMVEIIGEGGRREKPSVEWLGGVKVRLRPGVLVGLAVERPISQTRDFSTKWMLTLDLEW